jgi:serine/threonine-protein kinase
VSSTDPFGLVGQVLDGQIRVDAFVGEGGFSAVYRGHHQGLHEPVAIKSLKLPANLDASLVDTFIQRFRSESRILYRLSQGNLHFVRSIAAGTTQAPSNGALVPYMVLEWLEGRSLQSDFQVRRASGLTGRSLEDVLALFGTAADALAYAHAQGVIHRDLNPGNFFLATTSQGVRMKVLDFGVAKLMHDGALDMGPRQETVAHLKIFAPAYGAPEQFEEQLGPVGAPSDVYAFAIVMLEALRDRGVHDGTHLAHFVQSACDPNRRPTPRALGMDVSDAVESAFARATSLRPAERWASVGDFWRALTLARSLGRNTGARLREQALASGTLALSAVAAAAPRGDASRLAHTLALGSQGAVLPRPVAPSRAAEAPEEDGETVVHAPEDDVLKNLAEASSPSLDVPEAPPSGATVTMMRIDDGLLQAARGPMPSPAVAVPPAPMLATVAMMSPVHPDARAPRAAAPGMMGIAGPHGTPPQGVAIARPPALSYPPGESGYAGSPVRASFPGPGVGYPPPSMHDAPVAASPPASKLPVVALGVLLALLAGSGVVLGVLAMRARRASHALVSAAGSAQPSLAAPLAPVEETAPASPVPEEPPAPSPPPVASADEEPAPPAPASPGSTQGVAAAPVVQAAPVAQAPRPAPVAQPVHSAPSAPVAPTPPAAVDPNAFAESVARSRLAQANGVLAFCRRDGGRVGAGNALVTFGVDGNVVTVALDPPYAGTKEGDCVAAQFRRVRVPAFLGRPQTLRHAFDIPKS